MRTPSPAEAKGGRLRRTIGHLRAAASELLGGSAVDVRAWVGRGRARKVVAVASLAVVLLFVATTRVSLKGHWYGVFLLRSESGRPFELKDDLKLGDGPRLLWGFSFARGGEDGASGGRLPRLELEWDEEEGSGTIASILESGERVETYFGRYLDDEGKSPSGLFVGGSPAGVAAGSAQDQSGMALRDAVGWHHVWCNVNEALLLGSVGRLVFPGEWTFRGSQVLVKAPERVVLHSEHELAVGSAHLRMDRYAYFKAGRPFFRLGVNLLNVGDTPVTVSYAYGDDPWVGRFGSSAGNVGWTEQGIARTVAWIDSKASRWGGILDTATGLANFISWEGSAPDRAYFGNHPGTPRPGELGVPLASNEVSIGLEWRNHTIEPGERFSIQLTIGVAAPTPTHIPTVPEHAARGR